MEKIQKYDYLFVGAGLYSIVASRLLTNKGYKCFIIDKRNHIGGNCYTERIFNADVHVYGPHIFHTSDKNVWTFANKYAEFVPFQLNTKANYHGNIYSLPFNLNTFNELFMVSNPIDAKKIIKKDIIKNDNPQNLEEQALSQVGRTIYETLIKEYTEKQWNKQCTELSADIIKRLPVRFTWNNNYFNDTYQGLPLGGYTLWMMNILAGIDDEISIEYKLNEDFLNNKEYWINIANKVIYCGEPDRLMDYQLGQLEWRSLKFEHKIMKNDLNADQGCPIMNYTSHKEKYTRSIEHKYLTPLYKEHENKTITYEYPQDYIANKTDAYYPINNKRNFELYSQYVSLIKETYPNMLLGGRLGLYTYLDMDDTIIEAIKFTNSQ